jgi:hypothetical protein
MSKNQKNNLKITKSKLIERNLPVLRPARLKCEVHKKNVKNTKKSK